VRGAAAVFVLQFFVDAAAFAFGLFEFVARRF
jgi:hypothetical protein